MSWSFSFAGHPKAVAAKLKERVTGSNIQDQEKAAAEYILQTLEGNPQYEKDTGVKIQGYGHSHRHDGKLYCGGSNITVEWLELSLDESTTSSEDSEDENDKDKKQ